MDQNSEVVLLGCFFFQAEDGIRDLTVTGVQTCALPIWREGRGEGWQDLGLPPQAPQSPRMKHQAARSFRAAVEAGLRFGPRQRVGRGQIGRASCRERV